MRTTVTFAVTLFVLILGVVVFYWWGISSVWNFEPLREHTSLPCGEIEEMGAEEYTDRTRYFIASKYECYGARQCRSTAWVKKWEYEVLNVGDDPCEVLSNQ